MVFEELTMAKAAFKKAFGKAHTGNAKELANEALSSGVTTTFQNVYGESIDSTPATAVSAGIVLDCTAGAALDLVLDGSSNGKAYFTAVPTGHALLAETNPLTGSLFQVGERVSRVIPQSFGTSYRPVLKDNGTEVPPLASEDWFLDDFAGIITSEVSLGLGGTGTLECYVYVGKMLDTVIVDLEAAAGGGSGGAGLQATFQNGQDIDLDGYADLTIHSEVEYGMSVDTVGDISLESDGYVNLKGDTHLTFADANNATPLLFSTTEGTYGATLLTTRKTIVGAINEAFLSGGGGGGGGVGSERATYEITGDISLATGLLLDASQGEVTLISGAIELEGTEGQGFDFSSDVYVYVNGQLQINDTSTGITATHDVAMKADGTTLYFAYDLSIGDTIQLLNTNNEI